MNIFDMDDNEFEEAMMSWAEIEATHSWLYGAYDVRCIMCHLSKDDPRAFQLPCRVLYG